MAAWAPPRTSIRREKVIDWWAVVIRIGFTGPASTRSMRETAQALNGKAQIEIRNCGSIIANGNVGAAEPRDPPLKPAVDRNQHRRNHPLDPVIAPHGAAIDQIERQHCRGSTKLLKNLADIQ